jgi:hypothetical protein
MTAATFLERTMQRHLVLLAMILTSSPAAAQITDISFEGAQVRSITRPPRAALDTGSWSDGRKAGRDAADHGSVGGRAGLAFIGGLPVGFLGLLAVTDGDPVQTVPTGGGIALISFAFAARPARPSEMIAYSEGRGETYSRAFIESYSSRMRSRQRVAALAGGAAGIATGFGLLVYFLSHLE